MFLWDWHQKLWGEFTTAAVSLCMLRQPPVTHSSMTHSLTLMTNQDQDDIVCIEFIDEELEAINGGRSMLISFVMLEVNHWNDQSISFSIPAHQNGDSLYCLVSCHRYESQGNGWISALQKFFLPRRISSFLLLSNLYLYSNSTFNELSLCGLFSWSASQ